MSFTSSSSYLSIPSFSSLPSDPHVLLPLDTFILPSSHIFSIPTKRSFSLPPLKPTLAKSTLGTRKRSALGDLTNDNKKKSLLGLKDKEPARIGAINRRPLGEKKREEDGDGDAVMKDANEEEGGRRAVRRLRATGGNAVTKPSFSIFEDARSKASKSQSQSTSTTVATSTTAAARSKIARKVSTVSTAATVSTGIATSRGAKLREERAAKMLRQKERELEVKKVQEDEDEEEAGRKRKKARTGEPDSGDAEEVVPVKGLDDDAEVVAGGDGKKVKKTKSSTSLASVKSFASGKSLAGNKNLSGKVMSSRKEVIEILGDEEEVEEEEMVGQGMKERWAAFDALDAEDEGDPVMVSEYVKDIYQYLLELEKQTLPDASYMDNQDEINWKMRGRLIDWLLDLHTKFRLLPETIFLTVNIMDRFCSDRKMSQPKYQLFGITCMLLACKYEEICCPAIKNFLYMCEDAYKPEEVLQAEKYILKILDYDLSYPNPIGFLRRISKGDGYDADCRTFAKYFLEIAMVEKRLIGERPSLIAAAATWMARKVLDRGEWTEYFVYLSNYTQTEILPVAQVMLEYVVKNALHMHSSNNGSFRLKTAKSSNGVAGSVRNQNQTLQNFFDTEHGKSVCGDPDHPNMYKKYASKRFCYASEQVFTWAYDVYIFGKESIKPRLEEWDEEL